MRIAIKFNRFLDYPVHPNPLTTFLSPPLRQSLFSFSSTFSIPHVHRHRGIRHSAISIVAAASKSRQVIPSVDKREKKSSISSNQESTLVIVESPAKAATIQAILPASEYIVRSCVGHIREIPSSAKRIPAKYKEYPWARLGVDITSDFKPIYVLIAGKQAILTDLRKELQRSACLVLATDDDREGEAISWHLLEVLKPTVPVHRAVFHEITPAAIRAAFADFRQLNMALVDAQETRRVLDRLAGYTMSPLLWKKVAKGLSAGRVQSVALSEIVQRERERLKFKTARYAGCSTIFSASQGSQFQSTLCAIDGVRLVRGADFDDTTGRLRSSINSESVRLYDAAAMTKLCQRLDSSAVAHVLSVECRRTTRNPPAPLITSTLQQECGNRLGMGAGRTMSIAQKLYETGVITYMRTDNPTLSEDAVAACHNCIKAMYGKEAIRDKSVPSRKAKPKAAQAAHEAIRPTGTHFAHPDELITLSDTERAVYRIIYRRTLASEMAPAKLDQTTVRLGVSLLDNDMPEHELEFKATGSIIVEPGFLLVQKDADEEGSSTYLPQLAEGDRVNIHSTSVLNHETKPPPRFNDASLVKVLEELGVGRPSTYAGIIEKLITRGYVYRGSDLPADKKVPTKALVPSLTAFAVESLLLTHFPSFVDAKFTARMEQVLDDIAAGSADKVNYLREYYCGKDGLAESVARKENDIDASTFKQVVLPNMPREMVGNATALNGSLPRKRKESNTKSQKKAKKDVSNEPAITKSVDGSVDWLSTKVMVSSYGPYVEQNGTVIASLPKTTLADDLSPNRFKSLLKLAQGPALGKDPDTSLDVLLRTSRFGPYVQLGRDDDMTDGAKPKRCGLMPGMDISEVSLDLALKLLSLPRLLGTHPQSGEEIRAAIGPYGPYVAHGNTFVSLKKDEHNVLEIGFQEALALVDTALNRKQRKLEKQAVGEEKQGSRKGKSPRDNYQEERVEKTVKNRPRLESKTASKSLKSRKTAKAKN